MRLIITMPVYQDWESAALLCQAVDAELAGLADVQATILLVDDGSIQQIGTSFAVLNRAGLEGIRLLRLRRNLGHQRAIAVALAYIQQNIPCDAVIVMDADGEDRPAEIPRLIEAFRRSTSPTTVFVERGRRMDSLMFKTYYLVYRFFHSLVTGRGIRFGNFSLMPAEHLASIVAFPELWNHYAAAVLKSRLPYSTIRADRGYRLRGESRMNFVSLVIHGLSALFASYEVVSTRLLVGTGLMSLLAFVLVVCIVSIRLFTHLIIPGWAAIFGGLLLLMAFQLVPAALSIIFSVMMNRNSLGFLPLRDYSFFVADCSEIRST
jgi:polyisoprenyl-phosphate glycosyltransferase